LPVEPEALRVGLADADANGSGLTLAPVMLILGGRKLAPDWLAPDWLDPD